MTTNVIGVGKIDATFINMLNVKLACETAEIEYPKEVLDYFEFPGETEEYLRAEKNRINIDCAISRYGEEGTDGYEVVLSKLPKGVTSIMFENRY